LLAVGLIVNNTLHIPIWTEGRVGAIRWIVKVVAQTAGRDCVPTAASPVGTVAEVHTSRGVVPLLFDMSCQVSGRESGVQMFSSSDGDVGLWTGEGGHSGKAVEVRVVSHIHDDVMGIRFIDTSALLELAIWRECALFDSSIWLEWILKCESEGGEVSEEKEE
jgi:hypothetical protein